MKSDLSKLIILLSGLLLIAFPFAGLAPLTLLMLVAVSGWAFPTRHNYLRSNSGTRG